MTGEINLNRLPGTRRTGKWYVYVLSMPVFLYLGYIGGLTLELYSDGKAISEQFIYLFLHPFPISKSTQVLIMLLLAFAVWILFATYYTSSITNLMPGREFGSARFVKPEELNKKYMDKDDRKNRVLGNKMRMSINDQFTGRNNNILVIGGSGSGKSFRFLRPMLLSLVNAQVSLVCTDPKAELYEDLAPYLRRKGYCVKCFDLISPEGSAHYNPFNYIHTDQDIVTLVDTFISNTNPPNASESDPFWSKSESLYLLSLFYYVWLSPEMEGRRNLRSVIQLMLEAKATADGKEKSSLDKRIDELATREWSYPGETKIYQGKEHPSVIAYTALMQGAQETVQSVFIGSVVRFQPIISNRAVLDILDYDDIDLPTLGTGFDGRLRKSALFIVVPDHEKSLNCVAALLYSQMYNELYRAARQNGGRLKIPVMVFHDEFANTSRIADFEIKISTMRSRGISACIVLQDYQQLKAMYKDSYETIASNCDIQIHLGSNSAGVAEQLSKELGRTTIDKRSRSESKGSHGSSSSSMDSVGIEILSQDAFLRLHNDLSIIRIRGEFPCIDRKVNTQKTKIYKEAMRIKKQMEMIGDKRLVEDIDAFGPLGQDETDYYKGQGGVLQFTLEEFLALPDDILVDNPGEIDIGAVMEKLRGTLRKERAEEIRFQRQIDKAQTVASIKEVIMEADFSREQVDEAMEGFRNGLGEEDILSYFHPEYTPARMRAIREALEQKRGVGCGRFWTGSNER